MATEMVRAIQQDRNSWVRLWVLLSIVALWAGGGMRSAYAQEPARADAVRIQQMRVQVMPEFDDPRVLVMVQGRVSAESYPVRVTFRLPLGAQINQMATVNMATAGTTQAAYEREPDPENGRWELVSYELESAHFFYEYYYDPIVGETEKAFTYILNSWHAVDDVSVEVQEPKAAEGFRTTPEAATSRMDADLRLRYHEIPLGPVGAGEERLIGVNYRKTDPEPSLTWEQVMALQAGERAPEAAGAVSATNEFPIPTEIVVFVGGALLVLVGVVVGYRLRAGDRIVEREPEAYCRMCGTGLKGGAGYCHQCGAMVLPETAGLEGPGASGG